MRKYFLVFAVILVLLIGITAGVITIEQTGFLFFNRPALAIKYIDNKYHKHAIYEGSNGDVGDGAMAYYVHFTDNPKLRITIEDDGLFFPHFQDNYRLRIYWTQDAQILKSISSKLSYLGFSPSSNLSDAIQYSFPPLYYESYPMTIVLQGDINPGRSSEPQRLLELAGLINNEEVQLHFPQSIGSVYILDSSINSSIGDDYRLLNVQKIRNTIGVKNNFYMPNPLPINQMNPKLPYHTYLLVWGNHEIQ